MAKKQKTEAKVGVRLVLGCDSYTDDYGEWMMNPMNQDDFAPG